MKRVFVAIAAGVLSTLIATVFLKLLMPSLSLAAPGDIYCVASGDATTGTYSNCARVFTTVQAAVDAASGGEEIRIAGGIYTDVHHRAGITQVVYIDKNLALDGGYSDNFGSLNLPGNPTILDAQGRGRVIYVAEAVSVSIKGLDISGGNATAFGGKGGGIYLDRATATLRRNRIYSNTAFLNSSSTSRGSNRAPTRVSGLELITPPAIETKSLTGRLRRQRPSLLAAWAQLKQRNSVDDDSADGGGIYATGSVLSLFDNEIFNNIAGDSVDQSIDIAEGGGLYATESNLRLEGNVIRDNVGCRYGHYCQGGGLSFDGVSITLIANQIEGNTASVDSVHSSGGGAVLAAEHLVLQDNTILKNTACQNVIEDSGNHLILGGGMLVTGEHITLTNNQIISNTGVVTSMFSSDITLGGGLTMSGGEIRLEHNVIRGNIGVKSGYYAAGGGLYLEDIKHLTLSSNHINENIAAVNGQAGDGGGFIIFRYQLTDTFIIVNNNIIQGNIGSIAGGSVGGGAFIYSYFPDMQSFGILFQNNQILSNTATVSGTFGPGGGIVMSRCNARIFGNFFQNNDAKSYGGGLFLTACDSVIRNTAFVENQSTPGGAALVVDNHSTVQMLHTTFTGNHGGDGSAISLSHRDDAFSTLSMTNTIIASHTVGISVTTNNTVTLNGALWHDTPIAIAAGPITTITTRNQFSGAPHFTADGYHLQATSAAIGRGLDTAVINDIDGQPRRLPPDLGADEYWFVDVYLPLIVRDK